MSKKDKKKKKEKPASNSGTGKQVKYSGSIALTKLVHVRMNKKNKKGKKIDCLVIPIKKNYLTEGKDKAGKLTGAIYMNLSVITKEFQDDFGQNGFIGQNVSSDLWKAASDEQKEKMKNLPILGNIKNWESQQSKNDSAGSAGVVDEEDDLPF